MELRHVQGRSEAFGQREGSDWTSEKRVIAALGMGGGFGALGAQLRHG